MSWILALAACAAMFAAMPRNAAAQGSSAPARAVAGDLDFLLGSWDVTATVPSDPSAEQISYEVRRLTGSSWLTGRGRSRTVDASDVWGRDPASGEIMRMVFDASGTYAVIRSPGWRDGQLVLEGDAHSANGLVRVRETIRTIRNDEFLATWEAYRSGAWRAYSIERARRRPARRSATSRPAS
jgi:hypothetical protein